MDSIHVAQSPAKQSAYLNSFNTKNPDNAEKGAGGTSGDTDTSWRPGSRYAMLRPENI